MKHDKDFKQFEDSIKKKVKSDFGFTIDKFLDYDIENDKSIRGMFVDSEKRVFAFFIDPEQPENPMLWRRN